MKLFAHSLHADQKKLEEDSVQKGVENYRDDADEATRRREGGSLPASKKILLDWYERFCAAITKERRECKERRVGIDRGIYGQYMRLLDTKETAVIAMHTVVGMCLAKPAGIHTRKIVLAIGRNLCAHMARKRFKRTDRPSWNALMHTDRKQIKPKGVLKVARKFFPDEIWPIRVQGKLGAALLKLLLGVAVVQDKRHRWHPALEVAERWQRNRRYYYLSLTSEAHQAVFDKHTVLEVLQPVFQPMVWPPTTWTLEQPGGYLIPTGGPIKKSNRQLPPKSRVNQTVLDALNALNATPWRINKRILEIALALKKEGGNVSGIPSMSEIPKPPVPPDFDTNPKAKKAWKREAVRIRQENIMLKGERMMAWHKFDIAERFKDYERIYFPHELDFRGRAYPIPLFLNQQGDDLCRGLLEFAEGKVILDQRPRQWIKIHLANCCGIDKVSFHDREMWVLNNMKRFEKWHEDPLGHTGWLEVDKPFQALAATFAMCNAVPAAHLPIQVDGSNNALQHYGAMLRCPETAGLVNLIPGDMPADVYADVAARTRQLVARDAEEGNKYALKLEGWVKRKVVKQTVMTDVYGVTAVGARKQIHEWLVKAGFVDDELYQIARYLSNLVRQAVAGVCVAAHNAMQWLTKCGRIIARDGDPIRWMTPLGMRVEQPYRNSRQITIRTILHYLILYEITENSPVHVRKQSNRFAPNFVHSLDGAHMMLTANAAHRARITFAGVHDSFWTHAADMDTLGRLLRESFVKLHQEPLLHDLYRQLQAEYPTLKFPFPPQIGIFDINQVLDSDYFFS